MVFVSASERVTRRACPKFCIGGYVDKVVDIFPDVLSIISGVEILEHDGSINAHVCRKQLIMNRINKPIRPHQHLLLGSAGAVSGALFGTCNPLVLREHSCMDQSAEKRAIAGQKSWV